MGLQRCDDVIVTIAVHVVDSYLRTARTRPRPLAERRRMILPRARRWTLDFRLLDSWTPGLLAVRLFPPAEGIQKIGAAIAVDVADTHAVVRPRPGSLIAYFVQRPVGLAGSGFV